MSIWNRWKRGCALLSPEEAEKVAAEEAERDELKNTKNQEVVPVLGAERNKIPDAEEQHACMLRIRSYGQLVALSKIGRQLSKHSSEKADEECYT